MAHKNETKKEEHGKCFKGTVVSDAMSNSVVVEVTQYKKHPTYGKYVRSRKRYTAHDPNNSHQVGDLVVIKECAPISKTKRFTVVVEKERNI